MRVKDSVEGSEIKTFWTATTGAWQPVSLPESLKNSREVMLKIHDGTSGGYAHSKVEFEISSESDGAGWTWIEDSITIGIGVESADVICYVKAAVSQQISATVLR